MENHNPCSAASPARTGISNLDFLIPPDGITTIRCHRHATLASLLDLLLSNSLLPEKQILYFQMLDYHARYQTLDYDELISRAKESGADISLLLQNVKIIRAFSSDNVENEKNWEEIIGCNSSLSLIIVDAINELYEKEKGAPRRDANRKNILYVIGKILHLSMKNSCPAILFDTSQREIHPFLAHSSAAIIQIPNSGLSEMQILKHASQPEGYRLVSGRHQMKLWRWQR